MKKYIVPSIEIHQMDIEECVLAASLRENGSFGITDAIEDTEGCTTAWSRKNSLWDIEDE